MKLVSQARMRFKTADYANRITIGVTLKFKADQLALCGDRLNYLWIRRGILQSPRAIGVHVV